MEFARRKHAPVSTGRTASIDHRCPQCREQALVLQRRHVSPAQLGTPLVTEYYQCDCCDGQYQFSPADNRWRPLYT